MIIGRSPLRISLGGGGTDLPSYYRAHGGFVVSAAITQYVYVTMHRTPLHEMLLRYSQIERAKTVAEIRHPIIREALKLTGVEGPNIEITSMADIPAGTGLGSSGSFATCLLKVLHKFKRHFIHPRELAEMACHIEIDLLRSRSASRTSTSRRSAASRRSSSRPTAGRRRARWRRQRGDAGPARGQNLVMVSTGFYRAARPGAEGAGRSQPRQRPAMIDNLHFVKELGRRSLEAIEIGRPAAVRAR